MASFAGFQMRYLRSLGHDLKPSVLIGKQGVTEGVIKQIQDNLRAHELVKIRLQGTHGLERKQQAEALASATNSFLVQVLGCMVLLYLPKKEKPTIVLPKHPPKASLPQA